MKQKLHYAKLNLEEDISCLEFNNREELVGFLRKNIKEGIVYLLAINDNISDDVFVTDNTSLVIELFNNHLNAAYPFHEKGTCLFEFDSFEEAYEVALMIKEVSPLCYCKDKTTPSLKDSLKKVRQSPSYYGIEQN